ncbi:hypothetical protein [Azohydromonas lata]|uniref:Uncharacterized protein n=1 Tax=Azohydromonas lata TaxID=45677 RepID=A0ABU5IG72_9BURK|nr:hypothetical protein [Azohydromonas lata]MDZ5456948.1 hypothetical protein [Azohydromonas lata]
MGTSLMAVHREIYGNRLVRRVFDLLAGAVPAALSARLTGARSA